ncbi:hypothetical protein EVB78_144 [Rhizobium phage RHph_N1_15]|nr:hypothetical protein EVB77_144 [Rhizobium phage RHph_N1_10]QIG69346.1 hypothetical protein EVB78_144 [Rhizobium phage RHph_N1_15]QIG75206.1 hypothetical protein EVC15_144 [Rhizobium phage RHph_N2_6]
MSISIVTLPCGCFFAGRDFHRCEAHEETEPDGVEIKEVEIRLVQTCGACPEQYDAFLGDEQVGYLRLRHGHFSVDYPDVGEDTIFDGAPKGDGIFEDDEREEWLDKAKAAIVARLVKEGKV